MRGIPIELTDSKKRKRLARMLMGSAVLFMVVQIIMIYADPQVPSVEDPRYLYGVLVFLKWIIIAEVLSVFGVYFYQSGGLKTFLYS